MGTETVATLVLVAILVAVLAVYLLAIGFALRRLAFTLGTIVIGLRAIAQQTAPVGAVVGDLIGDVDVIEDALDGLVGAVVAAKKAPKKVAPAPAPAVVAARPTGTRPSQALAWRPGTDEPGTAPEGDVGEKTNEWDEVVGVTAADLPPLAGVAVGGPAPVPGRRSQARSSGRGERPAARAKRASGPMGDAVARARDKVAGGSRQ